MVGAHLLNNLHYHLDCRRAVFQKKKNSGVIIIMGSAAWVLTAYLLTATKLQFLTYVEAHAIPSDLQPSYDGVAPGTAGNDRSGGSAQANEDDRPVVISGLAVTDRTDQRFSFLARVYLSILGSTGQCTGSLISRRVVLTAGHCIVYKSFFKVFRVKFSSWEVVVGDLQSNTTGEPDEQKISGNGVAHPLYPLFSFPFSKKLGANDPTDIGVIMLNSDAQLSARVTLANLPSSSSFVPTLGSTATVAGWGRAVGDGDPSNDLLYGTVRVSTDPNSCSPKLTSKQTCFDAINTFNQSACNGDSGGPVMQTIDGKVVVIATVSYGSVGCPVTRAWAGVAVAPYLSWINKYIS